MCFWAAWGGWGCRLGCVNVRYTSFCRFLYIYSEWPTCVSHSLGAVGGWLNGRHFNRLFVWQDTLYSSWDPWRIPAVMANRRRNNELPQPSHWYSSAVSKAAKSSQTRTQNIHLQYVMSMCCDVLWGPPLQWLGNGVTSTYTVHVIPISVWDETRWDFYSRVSVSIPHRLLSHQSIRFATQSPRHSDPTREPSAMNKDSNKLCIQRRKVFLTKNTRTSECLWQKTAENELSLW